MSSDADYEAFLNKANQDSSQASTQQSKSIGINSVNTAIPDSLKAREEVYSSESDEPFDPISLSYKGNEIPAPGCIHQTRNHI
jgi:hypothetical protein